MSRGAALLAATALLGLAAASGCGLGAGESSDGEASLTVTRDFGAEPMHEATLTDPTESDTVVRFLDAEAEVETSYGGNFVDSIDGVSGSSAGGPADDWFYFVNGYWSELGAGEARVRPGDRIWWDHRPWASAYRVPAVVGSWPEPFLHGYQGERHPVVVQCMAAEPDCSGVVAALESEGVEPSLEQLEEPHPEPDALRVLVGPWDLLAADPAAATIEQGPSRSGVYAELDRCGAGWQLAILDSDAEPRQRLDSAALVAAVRRDVDQPTWLVTGTNEAAVSDAVALLDSEILRDRYAVASAGSEPLPLPAPDDSGADPGEACT